MERTLVHMLEALDECANTIYELAWALGMSRREAERGLEECVRRGLVVPPLPGTAAPMPGGLSPYLMLSSLGEDALAETGATEH